MKLKKYIKKKITNLKTHTKMGNIINSTKTSKHVLICGLDRAGKTTLFKLLTYSSPKDKNDQNQIKFESSIPKDEATLGFNFEYSDRDQANSIGFWDLGGKDTIRAIWQSFYKNIQYRGLIFVVNANDEDERINQARMELQKLMNEEELRSAVLYVVFNDVEKNEDDEDEDKEQRINEDPGVRNNVNKFLFF